MARTMTKAVGLVNALTLLAALHVPDSRLHAQAGLGHTEDASTPPKGMVRLRPIMASSRVESRFASSGVLPLGNAFTSDSLGVPSNIFGTLLQSSIRSLTQNANYRLSLGKSRMDATAREELLPLAVDFGVTNRIAFSVVLPVVRRRVATVFRLDSTGSNVGPNLNRTNAAATQQNALVQSEFLNAASQLQTRLASCQSTPSGPGCANILAQGPALLSEAQTFASLVEFVYGSSTESGAAFVPRVSSAEQAAIALRVADFGTRYSALLGSSVSLTVPRGAGGPAGVADYQSFVVNDLRGDSLNSQERVGLGDVELALKVRLIDRPATELRAYGLQVAVGGGVRLPTGSSTRSSGVEDLSLGSDRTVLHGTAVVDASIGRFGFTTAANASASTGAEAVLLPDAGFVSSRPTDWVEVHARPRWRLSQALSLHAAYSYRSSENGADHLAGAGLSFLPLATRPGDTPPMEMRFTHLEAIRGDPGMPKFFREQLEVRVYLRLFR